MLFESMGNLFKGLLKKDTPQGISASTVIDVNSSASGQGLLAHQPIVTGDKRWDSFGITGAKKSKKQGKKKRREVSNRNSKVSSKNTVAICLGPPASQDIQFTGTEDNIRSKILDSFLKSSHGDLVSFGRIHKAAIEKDPLFYGHLARWYFENGTVRDHRELFVIHLITSAFTEHREHGFVLLQRLRRYQLARIVKYCKEVLHFTPRTLKTAIKYYLKRREAHHEWFDECVIRDRQSLKYLYSTLHIKPGVRAEEIVFKDNPPETSRVYSVKELAKNRDNPARQAELILNNHIHYTTAIGAIKQYTPAIIYALANVMTPMQVINNLKFLQDRGALADPSTRSIIEQKLQHGIKENRVSDFKSIVALKQINADEQMAQSLLRITAERLKNRGRITVPTALFVDKSSSMNKAIEIGKLLATMCSSIADADLHVFAFDSGAFRITAKTSDFTDWAKAFAPIKANGCTSIGVPFTLMKDVEVDQIVVITDGEENTSPLFGESLEKYEKQHNRKVKVIMIRVDNNGGNSLEHDMKGKDFSVIHFDGDYYNLPNVIPLLCGGSNHELVNEIMQIPLYKREEDLKNLPPGFDEKTFEIIEN